jgi:hypothetical protein
LIMRFLFAFIIFLRITIEFAHRNDGVGPSHFEHKVSIFFLSLKFAFHVVGDNTDHRETRGNGLEGAGTVITPTTGKYGLGEIILLIPVYTIN